MSTISSHHGSLGTTQLTKWNKTDTVWMFGLYATAVGAGTLFLPINAGLNGPLVLLLMALFAFPLTYLPHRALSRFVLSGSSRDGNIQDVVVEHFGVLAGKIIMVLYLMAFFPIVLVYSISITNALDSFLIHQFHLMPVPRIWLSLVVVVLLNLVLLRGKDTIVAAMGVLVFPLLVFLLGISLYLVPTWQTGNFVHGLTNTQFNNPDLWHSLWLAVPVMVFSFSHAPIISSFASTQKSLYGDKAERRCARIMRYSYVLICVTVLFFVFSCVLSLSHQEMAQAKAQNITVLTTLANKFSNPLIAYLGPVMAMLAMAKSYLGTSLGVTEGATSLIDGLTRAVGRPLSAVVTHRISGILLFLLTWAATVWNPSALHIIETISGPLIAVILFILPMYAVRAVPAMRQYRALSNVFVLVMGLIALSALVYGLL
ncbi:serine transporter [Serratia fonticola]|jgi:serine transporter|uniref:Serine transporter n=1 Tax=Serratia fonticola TaxID=47917 RepID=A0A559TBY6_SERFO|nr:HAAAP family serine/threonine permease [Serratia fonticola]TQI80334.1 serine transporter [Serratia fonticola]TQI97639.1 serine transporter [Serratia fonticola]TVZ72137.1 serine transporter [Serratia fonticola]